MPGQQRRSGPQPCHPRITALIGGTLTVLSLALSACTSAAPATTAATAPASTGPGASTSPAQFTGAGSTFDAPFFSLAFARYHQQHPGVSVRYSAVGSSAGIASFSAGQVNFGASDVPMTAAQQAAARGGPSVQVPVDLGAEVVVYHVLLPGTGRLHLTGPVIARIFLGQITRWDDPAITALNPQAELPHNQITVVHRSDGSGTTYIFSNYLSSVDPAWASRLGTSTTINWPVGTGAKGNAGVAAVVARIPFSIGYVERSYSRGPVLTYAAIRNKAGQFTIPTTASVAADAAQKTSVSAANFSIVNEPGANSYPISGYSWALIYLHQHSHSTGLALVQLMDWLTHSGQAYAAQANYIPLPPVIQALARTTLQQVLGSNGQPLLG